MPRETEASLQPNGSHRTAAAVLQPQLKTMHKTPSLLNKNGMHRPRVCHTGVQGIGSEDSALALYEDAEGDRGILTDQVTTQNCCSSAAPPAENDA